MADNHQDKTCHINGVECLASNLYNPILACPKCGEEHFRDAFHIELHEDYTEHCFSCGAKMELIKMDELESRWVPFWVSLGFEVHEKYLENGVLKSPDVSEAENDI